MKNRRIILVLISFLLFSCGKEWLDIKQNKQLVIPSTIEDLQALLNNFVIMNTSAPILGEISADDYFIDNDIYKSLRNAWEKNAYSWNEKIYEDPSIGGVPADWGWPYQRIYYANTILESVPKLKPANQQEDQKMNELKGMALFHRSFGLYHLSQIFCSTFEAEGENGIKYGLPLRLNTDLDAKLTRGNLEETYNQMINDLLTAEPLLPSRGDSQSRLPSKAANEALLARIYLIQGKYSKALEYAELSMQKNSDLIDFKNIDQTLDFPFPRYNSEVIFYNTLSGSEIFDTSYQIDTTLMASYSENDLRKNLFFTNKSGRIQFRGSYDGTNTFFGGIAVDEMYLIKAECEARIGQKDKAYQSMLYLLSHRFESEIQAKEFLDADSNLLNIILEERRKELLFRGIRWSDLRRLNLTKDFEQTLNRNIDGKHFALLPNDNKYVLPIPDYIIFINKFLQNPR
ncbi:MULTISPECIES: RagB/SusD family nutrient uptake outer membrane protein [Sphingobacterium]|uniref:RagB/SusD family nutrient uptake outer membrane protein n=1 Tax=Sphingobacterium TaxID=28453 RepID=UPI000E8FE648|nr:MULTISPECIES: RagB/SusD family nutrient uptake outer membrane protein [Sphingobacterium]HAU53048.1 RagB/SusD family nutrient uptake outer membrane protein [Sphingobacterium sp.]HCX63466.1 RagB/SusD family nutrient uptake outer membrane protein [Clostridiales bacterium]